MRTTHVTAHTRSQMVNDPSAKRDAIKNPHTVQITKTAWKYEGLTKEAKEKALEELRNDYSEGILRDDLHLWSKDIEENEFPEKGLKGLHLLYDLSYSQGSGVAFEGMIDAEYFIKSHPQYKQYLKMVKATNGSVTFTIKNDNRYIHSRSFSVKIDHYGSVPEKYNKQLDEFEKDVRTYLQDYSNKLEQQGYEEIDYRLSDESLLEFSTSNDILFTEKGKIFHME